MFTRSLFKPFLTFTILALLLLPQIGETGPPLRLSLPLPTLYQDQRFV